MMRQATTKVLVVYDVQVKTPDVNQVPLIINYGTSVGPLYVIDYLTSCSDLPKAVEEYAHR